MLELVVPRSIYVNRGHFIVSNINKQWGPDGVIGVIVFIWMLLWEHRLFVNY